MKTINGVSTLNHKLKALLLLATVAGLFVAVPGTLHAQDILEKESISATIIEQNTNTIDNGTTTTTKAPGKVALTTGNLLHDLAVFEFNEGNWATNYFPANAKLDFNGTGFEVDQGTNELVDVSDALSYTQSGQNDISTSSYSDANGQGSPPYSQTDYYLVTVTYTGSAYSFAVTGLATVTSKATKPGAKGNYTQSGSFSLQNGTGEGTATLAGGATTPIVLNAFTMSASGSALENNGAGAD